METPSEPPPGHTADGGVRVGSDNARRRLVIFEDPQCPYCRNFEQRSGDLLRREIAAGSVAVEYRIRSFLGVESARAANALAAAAAIDRFDPVLSEIFANQPPEHSGGFTTADLLEYGRRAGVTSSEYVMAVTDCRYGNWVREIEASFQEQDPAGTPYAILDGQPIDTAVLYEPELLGAAIRA